MRVSADTNVLLRIFVDDDAEQSKRATAALGEAELIAISPQVLCEFVWVLHRHYETSRRDIAAAIEKLLETERVIVNRPAIDAGLAVLLAGGDFADGVIAFEGRMLGGDTFLTFDRKSARILDRQGHATRLLSE